MALPDLDWLLYCAGAVALFGCLLWLAAAAYIRAISKIIIAANMTKVFFRMWREHYKAKRKTPTG